MKWPELQGVGKSLWGNVYCLKMSTWQPGHLPPEPQWRFLLIAQNICGNILSWDAMNQCSINCRIVMESCLVVLWLQLSHRFYIWTSFTVSLFPSGNSLCFWKLRENCLSASTVLECMWKTWEGNTLSYIRNHRRIFWFVLMFSILNLSNLESYSHRTIHVGKDLWHQQVQTLT